MAKSMTETNKQKRIDRFIRANTDPDYGRGNSGAKIPAVYDVEPNDTADILSKMKILWELPKPNTNEELTERVYWYFFEYCLPLKMKPSIEGVTMALGICKETFSSWGQGERTQFHTDLVKKCREMVQMFLSQSTFEGKLNPSVWMFYGKNYFGMSDKQEVVLTPNQGINDVDVQAIQERMKTLPSAVQQELAEGNGK